MICISERESESWREIYAYTLYHILPREVQKRREIFLFDPLSPSPSSLLHLILPLSILPQRPPIHTKIHAPKKKKKKTPTLPPFLTSSSLLSKVDNSISHFNPDPPASISPTIRVYPTM